MRSGSASLTATSVMAEDMRRSSCARQTRIARNQNRAMGMMTVATTAMVAGLAKSSAVLPAVSRFFWKMAHDSTRPSTNQTTDAPMAIRNGEREGRCCSA